VIPKLKITAKANPNMIVFAKFGRGRANPHRAGHAQVANQGAVAKPKQQVLGASVNGAQASAFQQAGQVVWHGPTQSCVEDLNLANTLADQVRFQAAAGGFDLGEFRHAGAYVSAAESTPHSFSRK
jgi:hypothetical protein